MYKSFLRCKETTKKCQSENYLSENVEKVYIKELDSLEKSKTILEQSQKQPKKLKHLTVHEIF